MHPMLTAKSCTSWVTAGSVPGWGMTSTTVDALRSWKWRAQSFSGLPVASANMDGTSMEVLVVKTVRPGQSLWNWAKTFALMSGSSGTDSLMMSASRAASPGLSVEVMRAMVCSSCSFVSLPVEAYQFASFPTRLTALSRMSRFRS